MTENAKLICYPNNSYGSFVVYANFPEYEELNFINKIISNGDTVLDVGANIGSESILAASKGEKVKVFAFEPTTNLIPLLQDNIAINGFNKRIKCVKKAVSNKNGTLQFVLEPESEINHIASKVTKNTNVETVECVTLDTFINSNRINCVDLLKVDVEGAELLVFEGCKKSLRNKVINIILFEVNEKTADFGYSSKELISYLAKKKYFIFRFEKDKLTLINENMKVTETINLVAVQKNPNVIKKIIEFL